MPYYIVFACVLSFGLIMAWVAYQKSQESGSGSADTPPKTGSSRMFAEQITENYDGLIPPDVPEEPAPQPKETEESTILLATPNAPNLDAPPIPPGRGQISPDDEYLMRIRAAKLQMFEQALQSKTGVPTPELSRSAGLSRDEMISQIAATRTQIEAFSSNAPARAYKMRLDAMRNAGILPAEGNDSGGAPASLLSGSRSAGNDYTSYDNARGNDRWSLDTPAITKPGRYMLRAGATVLPATLISGINSDLPGQVQAQVSQDVFDTATGKHLLIPQGTRLVGQYNSDVAYGQERVLMAWQRLVFPDGRALDLGSMHGADSGGYAGFADRVNSHFFRAISSAFLMSGVIAGVSLSQNRSNSGSDNQRAGDAMSEALGQTMGQALAQMLMKNLNVAPTIEIRPGYRLNVMVSKDINFPGPYVSTVPPNLRKTK